MQKFIRPLTIGLAISSAALASQAQTTLVLDFENPALVDLYFAGDGFSHKGFDFLVQYDSALVTTFDAADPTSPTGNATQYYQQLNEGWLVIGRPGAAAFDLLGFSAAFVPLAPASGQSTAIVVDGQDIHGAWQGVAYTFAGTSGGRYQFDTYDTTGFGLVDMRWVEFYTCPIVGGGLSCTTALKNNGQFALDDITVSVPEPETAALLAIGLLGLALRRRARG